MEAALESGADWLIGELFSLADIALTPYVARLEYLTLLDLWTSNRPAVCSWWQRIKERPSYRTAIPEALTSQEIDEMQVTGARIKDRVRALHADYTKGG